MRNNLRSAVTMTGRRMAGARSLWRANGMKDEQFGMPVIGIVNSFTQFVPGHTHLHEIGQYVKTLIEERGCFAAEFHTIAGNHRRQCGIHGQRPSGRRFVLYQ